MIVPKVVLAMTSILFQSKAAICWYCKYTNPAMNNPTITATTLTTFLRAYPNSSPPKNPPPTIAEAEVIMSALKP